MCSPMQALPGGIMGNGHSPIYHVSLESIWRENEQWSQSYLPCVSRVQEIPLHVEMCAGNQPPVLHKHQKISTKAGN